MLIIQFILVKMILKELVLHLDRIFKKNLALDWDKTGLQIGNLDSDIENPCNS